MFARDFGRRSAIVEKCFEIPWFGEVAAFPNRPQARARRMVSPYRRAGHAGLSRCSQHAAQPSRDAIENRVVNRLLRDSGPLRHLERMISALGHVKLRV